MLEGSSLNKEDLVKRINMGRPHVVLLGAGASRASFLNGDKNGIHVPLMNDLFEFLKLRPILKKYDIETKDLNFENFFSDLSEKDSSHPLIKIIEDKIFNFFSKLALPDYPTIYDYLVLSLREKDVIATFNWDPFLYMAAKRNNHVVNKLPHLIFLHGNVAVGYCESCKLKGQINYACGKCGKMYTPSKLLYPVKKKEYNSDPIIRIEWAMMKKYIEHSYIFSVFGYSAPKTDVEAIKIFEKAWTKSEVKDFSQIEFICKPNSVAENITRSWKKLLNLSHYHYDVIEDFFDSIISKYPRRTCEALWAMTMENKFVDENFAPRVVSLIELQDWFKQFLKHEKE